MPGSQTGIEVQGARDQSRIEGGQVQNSAKQEPRGDWPANPLSFPTYRP